MPHNGRDALFVIIVLVGVLAGLAFLVPAGMAHSAFVKAHPYVEDFYTEDDRARAHRARPRCLRARGHLGHVVLNRLAGGRAALRHRDAALGSVREGV